MGNKFKKAVEATPDIKDGYCDGLQALGKNSKRVNASDTRLLNGSVDIDACTEKLYPNESRWDYVVGFDSHAYFLEIHPAKTREVESMIKKKQWLDSWLSAKAPTLKDLAVTNVFYWIPSGGCDIIATSSQSRKLAQSKIKIVKILKLGEYNQNNV